MTKPVIDLFSSNHLKSIIMTLATRVNFFILLSVATFIPLHGQVSHPASIKLYGQEFYDPNVSSNDGVSFLMGVNRDGNRQLWIGDSKRLGKDNINGIIRIMPNAMAIDAIATNGFTTKNLTFNQNGGNVGIGIASDARFTVSGNEFGIEKMRLSGEEFYQSGNNNPHGISFLLGVNRVGNRQLWLASSDQLSKNNTNKVIRFFPGSAAIDAFSTDGITPQDLILQPSTGNVGIGTGAVAPDAKLTVKGDIHAQEVKVDMDGSVAPDYVFESDYNLTELSDVAEFIGKNKHLPDVPSASELNENGLMLKEMNMLLLKKIEELTLYQIQLLEKLNEQEARLKALEAN